MDLSKYRSDLYHCLHCHLCYAVNWQKIDEWRFICPTAARFGFESFNAAGRIEIARAIIEGNLVEKTEKLLDIFYSCTGCNGCMEQCHELTGVKTDHTRLFEDIKAFFVEKGWGPLPKHLEFGKSIIENHNPYNEPHEKRFDWLDKKIRSDSSLIYFVGCTSSYRQQAIAKATVKILEKSDVPFTILDSDEWCCGSPIIRTGQLGEVKKIAIHNVESIQNIGAKKVIFSCAGCFNTFKNDYKRLGLEFNFKIYHTSQFFLELLRQHKMNVRDLKKVVTYHDPCHLGRHSNVYKQPRKVLNYLNVDFHEFQRNSKESFCCGAGSGVRAAYPEFAKWTAKNRLDEVNETGADILVSTCPFCKNNFVETKSESSEYNFEIMDLSELLLEALNDK
ncbi:MAG: (Fe-S)-binding protein [Candidatus Lokiarchaeota archaeon]|nr:(Fe-S)-binding protein [Candidatus Lokiarchaeota archaeon]